MTTDDLIARIAPLHQNKPQFAATVALSVAPFVALTEMLAHLPVDFDIDSAIGAQLDVVGEWVGRDRFLEYDLLDLRFRWNDAGRGWGAGFWSVPFDPGTGQLRLPDVVYRSLLKGKAAANRWDGTVPDAQNALNLFFDTDTDTRSFVTFGDDMTMQICVAQAWPVILKLALLAKDALGIKPAGVRTTYVVSSVDRTPLFGWGIDNQYIGGWGQGSWGVPPEAIFEGNLT